MNKKKTAEELTDLEKNKLLNELDAETDLAMVQLEGKLILKMPIQIIPTVNHDGYIITDANNIQHFFYFNEKGGALEYDGWSVPLK